MQNEIICTGKTIDLAIEEGLAQLGLSRDDVSVEILETPVRRLFKSTPAKVKITRDEPIPVPVKEPVKSAPAPKKPAEKPVQQQKLAPQKNEQPSQPSKPQKQNKPKQQSTPKQPRSNVRTEEDIATLNRKTEIATEFLNKVFGAMELGDVTITPETADRGAVLGIAGENLSILIGKRGETMEALSYLTSLVANSIGGNFEKMSLDVAGYREKRESDLGELAKRIATNVLSSGRPYALEPMNPYERRIIHTAIGEIEGVASESQGDGERRHIVIYSEAEGLTDNIRYSDRDRGRRGPRRGERNDRDGKSDRYGRGKNQRGDRDRRPKQPPVVSTRTEKVDDDTAKPLFSKIEL